jgi:hypothetical protein
MYIKKLLLKTVRSSTITKKIFSSETTRSIKTKLWWNGPWVIPFQNCVRQSRPPTNIAAVTKNKKGRMKILKSSSLKLLGQLELSFA